jgi:hypothetical protein
MQGKVEREAGRTQDLPVRLVGAHTVHYGEAELALGQVLAEALVVGVLRVSKCGFNSTHLVRLQVHVVVAYLEVDRDEVDEGDVVAGNQSARSTPCPCYRRTHTLDADFAIMSLTAMRNSPPVSGYVSFTIATTKLTPKRHLHILLLSRTRQAIAPVQVHALSAVEVEQFICGGV